MKDSMIGQQLPLPVGLDVESTFDNYYLPKNSVNLQVLHGLYALVIKDAQVGNAALLWGEENIGLTHLLKACASQAERFGQTSYYLSLLDNDLTVEEFTALGESVEFLCLDDIDKIAGSKEWEVALFTVFNQLKDKNNRLLFASHTPPQNLIFALADMRSRVLSGPVYQLNPLSDDDKVGALQLQAYKLGMNMPLEVATYIVNHSERNLGFLFELLDLLDRETLVQKRKLTVPFVKQTIQRLNSKS